MPKMTFVCEHRHPINKDSNLSKVTYESNREYLYDIIEDFEDFLRGCGFYIDGKLEVVDNEDVEQLTLTTSPIFTSDIDSNFSSMNDTCSSIYSTDTITMNSSDFSINLNKS